MEKLNHRFKQRIRRMEKCGSPVSNNAFAGSEKCTRRFKKRSRRTEKSNHRLKKCTRRFKK